MESTLTQREVVRIDSPAIRRGYSDAHRARALVEPGNWAASDPFLLLMEDWFPIGVFEQHPHRGIETVTYVLEGELEHYDNHGQKGRVRAGDALWLTAGRGLIHNELPLDGETVHILQLWVNLPRKDKLVSSRLQVLDAAHVPIRREGGAELRVFSGESGHATSATQNYAKVTMVEARLEPSSRIEQLLPPGYNAFVVVVSGEGTIGTSATVRAGQVAFLSSSEAPSAVLFASGEQHLRAILFAGYPLRESVAARGPFVMNTEEELKSAYAEYRAAGEKFGR